MGRASMLSDDARFTFGQLITGRKVDTFDRL